MEWMSCSIEALKVGANEYVVGFTSFVSFLYHCWNKAGDLLTLVRAMIERLEDFQTSSALNHELASRIFLS